MRGQTAKADAVCMRPFGAHPDQFDALCRECSDCFDACPQAIIVADPQGRAAVDPRRGACTFCQDCAKACPTGALTTEITTWPWRARIEPHCLSLQAISCRACQDACDARAISFRLATGGRALPKIDLTSCTGCGGCAGFI